MSQYLATEQAEESLWVGRPSQVTNMGAYILCTLFCWLVVPIFIGLWKWIQLRNLKYELTTERLRTTQGVFSKRTDDLELYRVKDTTYLQPFFLRMFKLGNIELETSDKSSPFVVLHGIRNASEVREQLRRHVERRRDQKRVREVDFE